MDVPNNRGYLESKSFFLIIINMSFQIFVILDSKYLAPILHKLTYMKDKQIGCQRRPYLRAFLQNAKALS